MSKNSTRWIFWLTLVFVCPVPFFLSEIGSVPPARILMLAFISAAVIVVEGGQGAVTLAAAFLFVQGLLYLGVFWVVADLAARLIARLPRKVAVIATATVVLGAVVLASAFDVYRTPFNTRSLQTSLRHVYE